MHACSAGCKRAALLSKRYRFNKNQLTGAMVWQALLEAERKGMVPLLEAPKHFHDKVRCWLVQGLQRIVDDILLVCCTQRECKSYCVALLSNSAGWHDQGPSKVGEHSEAVRGVQGNQQWPTSYSSSVTIAEQPPKDMTYLIGSSLGVCPFEPQAEGCELVNDLKGCAVGCFKAYKEQLTISFSMLYSA